MRGMEKDESYLEAIRELADMHQQDLDKHGAVDFIAGQDFVAYVIPELDGKLSADVWSWGVHHGKVATAQTIEELKSSVYNIYA